MEAYVFIWVAFDILVDFIGLRCDTVLLEAICRRSKESGENALGHLNEWVRFKIYFVGYINLL